MWGYEEANEVKQKLNNTQRQRKSNKERKLKWKKREWK
jgi:hypothetical protein